MAILTDLPVELHQQIVKGMLQNLELGWAPHLATLAAVSPYWNDLVEDTIGKRLDELWQQDKREREDREKAEVAGYVGYGSQMGRGFHARRKRRHRARFEKQRARRLEKILGRVLMVGSGMMKS